MAKYGSIKRPEPQMITIRMNLVRFKVLTLRGFTSRPQLWPGLAKLLNEVIQQVFLKMQIS